MEHIYIYVASQHILAEVCATDKKIWSR